MKRTIVAEFNSTTALMAFKQAKQLTNCVIIDNTLHCDLSDSDMDQLTMYGGRLLKELLTPQEAALESEMATVDLCAK